MQLAQPGAGRAQARPCPSAASCRRAIAPRRRATIALRAALTDKGKRLSSDSLAPVGSLLGEGSYGQVFRGLYSGAPGTDEPQQVILKRVRPRVLGAAEMAAMEHLINVHAARNCRGAVADFLGFAEVSEDDAAAAAAKTRGGFFGGASSSSSSSRLTPGLWLVWRFEGINTLAYYLRRRDALRALGRDLGIEAANNANSANSANSAVDAAREAEALAAALALRHVLAALASLHGAGLVHRDVKPLNLILSERDRRLKLIDLGAAADLRGGTNFNPEESILDPLYAPPEQFALPTSSVDLSAAGLAALAVSPVLWAAHRPDRFDSWSAGVVLLQLALPAMRNPKALANFKGEYEACGFDLRAWRDGCRWLPRRDWAVLDAWGGSGWDLAQGLLQPRANLEMGEDGSVSFSAGGGGGGGGGGESGTTRPGGARLSASEALRHPFLRAAAALEKQLSGGGGSSSSSSSRSASASPGGSATSPSPSYQQQQKQRQQQRGASPARSGSSSSSGGEAADEARMTPAERRARMLEQRQRQQQDDAAASAAAFSGRRPRSATPARAGGSGARGRSPAAEREQDGSSSGSSKSSRGLLAAAASTWRSLADRLFDLEASVFQAATEAATATTTVKKLKERAASASKGQQQQQKGGGSGARASPSSSSRAAAAAAAALPAAQERAARAQARLEALQREASDVSARARGIWGLLGIGKPSGGGGSDGGDSAAVGGSKQRGGGSPGATANANAAANAASTSSAVGAAVASGSSALAGFLSGAWGALGERLVALEAGVAAAEREAESQTAKVRRLRAQAGGKGAEELAREERALEERERALGEARGRYESAWRQATAALAGMVLPAPTTTTTAAASPSSSSSSSSSADAAAPADTAASTAAAADNSAPEGSASASGGRRSPIAGLAYAGLRLGGLAAKVVADAVASAGADAYRAVAALEAEGEARARARAADAAFLEALRKLLGEAVAADVLADAAAAALSGGVKWEGEEDDDDERDQAAAAAAAAAAARRLDPAAAEAAAAAAAWERASRELASDPVWLGVSGGDARRRQLLDAYVSAARQVAARRAEQAQAALRGVFASAGADERTEWGEVEPLVDADPRCAALPQAARRRLFERYRRDAALERAARAAQARLSASFRALLEQAAAPPVTASTRWASARAQFEGDPAFEALPEDRRGALFRAYVQELREREDEERHERQQQAAEAAASLAAAAASSSSMASSSLSLDSDSADEAALSAEDLAQLRLLRQEQARLRDEYERMERKLREVEGRLVASSSSPSASSSAAGSGRASPPSGAASPTEEGTVKELVDGAVLYKFD